MNLLHLPPSSWGVAVPRTAMTHNYISAPFQSEGLNKTDLGSGGGVGGSGSRRGTEGGVARKEPGSVPAINTAGSKPDQRFSAVSPHKQTGETKRGE